MAHRFQLPSLFGGSPPTRWSGDPFLSLRREMDRLFQDAARGFGGLMEPAEGIMIIAPRIDVSETDTEIRVAAELPGIEEKDIDVSVTEDVLTIRGERRMERDEEKENYHLRERSFGSFARAIQLPFQVGPEQVRAEFQNGLLIVSVPKPSQQKHQKSHRVQIRGAQRQVEGSGSGLGSAATEMRSADEAGAMGGKSAAKSESTAHAQGGGGRGGKGGGGEDR